MMSSKKTGTSSAKTPKKTDFNEVLKDGIELCDKLKNDVDQQIDGIEAKLNDMKGGDQNTIIAAFNEKNKLNVFKAKLALYSKGLTDKQNPPEKKIALLGVMVELADTLQTPSNTQGVLDETTDN